MLAIPLGLGNALSRYPTKLHPLTLRVELFYFVCRMKLVLRLDVGRWSRILRAWNNCQESRFDPMLAERLGVLLPSSGFRPRNSETRPVPGRDGGGRIERVLKE